MHTEFRKIVLPRELRSVTDFDRKIFSKADRFPSSEWLRLESFWMLIDGVKVGCCAFQTNVIFQEDVREDGENPRHGGLLYIASTGILPARQGEGLGTLLKTWEIAYARRRHFRRVITNCRKSNQRMIALNRRFGFRRIRTTPNYYADPTEATVVMELRLD